MPLPFTLPCALAALLAVGQPRAQEPRPAAALATAPVTLRIATVDGTPRPLTVDLARHHRDDLPLTALPAASGFVARRFAPADFVDGEVTLRNLPPGCYVFVVAAAGHAVGFSAPTRIDAEPKVVTVRLQTGVTIVGRIVGEDGKPVAGATVTTDAAGAKVQPVSTAQVHDHSVLRVTRASTSTDAMGRYEVPHLAPGAYLVRAGHADWCPAGHEDLQLRKDGERRELAPLTLRRGALVVGSLLAPTPRPYDLELRTRTRRLPNGTFASELLRTARTAADGTFRFPMRVPPGRYELRAEPSRDGAQAFGSNFGAFDVAIEVRAGETEVAVPLRLAR